ncbi:Pituitary adenylate cyclase-activating polypeptide type I receptor like [Quillaja saponaria]|uniref:Pituitary adenylate cyclase-activating polypeptide type I receptor like n=1 Tax=Quillaja saponaria TaxID=32244 RepID=A0AAD7L164_QUISA|nr:Pituitary adenylate cyclase-activating polypeptide type I receptor like [Quillaja saponaria]
MGQAVELLDQGISIATKFHSHCSQTGRMRYHPPPANSENNPDYNHSLGGAIGSGGDLNTQMRYCVSFSLFTNWPYAVPPTTSKL